MRGEGVLFLLDGFLGDEFGETGAVHAVQVERMRAMELGLADLYGRV